MAELADRPFTYDQETLRKRFVLLVKMSDKTVKDLALDVGLNRMCLGQFIHGKKAMFRSVNKIERWCVLQEKLAEQKEILKMKEL